MSNWNTAAKLTASSSLLLEEAIKRGFNCQTFPHMQAVRLTRGDFSCYVAGSRTSFQSSIGYSIATHKRKTKIILKNFDIPTANYTYVRSAAKLPLIKKLTFPLVMKPVEGHQGIGVEVGIRDYEQAEQLFAKSQGPQLFEEMLKGTEYRIVCIDYMFAAAAYRKPAFVTGDGAMRIKDLIAQKNAHPWRGDGHKQPLTKIIVDDNTEKLLQEQGYNLESMVPAGQDVFLRKTANLSTGGEAFDVTDQVHPENIALFEKIAQVTDLNTIGIDVMCTDISAPIADQTQAGIIEINASPGLRMHHFPMAGQPRDLAAQILNMIERRDE